MPCSFLISQTELAAFLPPRTLFLATKPATLLSLDAWSTCPHLQASLKAFSLGSHGPVPFLLPWLLSPCLVMICLVAYDPDLTAISQGVRTRLISTLQCLRQRRHTPEMFAAGINASMNKHMPCLSPTSCFFGGSEITSSKWESVTNSGRQ